MNSPAELPSCFSLILQKEKLTKKGREAKLQLIICKKKITSRSPLRFLGKCAGRNLISVRSLYPFDDAIDQTIGLLPDGLPSRLVWGIGEQKVGKALLLLLELPPLREFLLAWIWKFLEREEDLRVLAP